jgi:aminoglycoside 6'-N-acetyltransferase I
MAFIGISWEGNGASAQEFYLRPEDRALTIGKLSPEVATQARNTDIIPHMLIRPGHPHDEETLVALRSALWPDEPPNEGHEAARALLAGKWPGLLPATVFVAESGGGLVGFVEVSLRSYADGCAPDQPVGYLEGWYVVPEERGRGVGRRLVEAAEGWCREQGCREMGSDTWLDNEASQQAHEALGFEVVDRCVNYRKPLESPG